MKQQVNVDYIKGLDLSGISTNASNISTNTTAIANSVQPDTDTVFSAVVSSAKEVLTSTAASISWTGQESNLYGIILTEDSTLENPSSPITNALYQFIIEQDATGLWSLSYGSQFKFSDGIAPVIDLNANSKGILTALYDGTDLLVTSIQNFL